MSKPIKKLLIILVILILFIFVVIFSGNKKENYNIEIKIKDYGIIKAELYPDVVPITVENFVNLIKNNFYDNLTFHRIVKGFVIQGGDASIVSDKPYEKTIIGEFRENGRINKLSHTRGVLSMARAEDYNSASTQFFIVIEDALWLDGKYASFGKVTSGMEVVDKIAENTIVEDDGESVLKENQPIIEYIKIIDNN